MKRAVPFTFVLSTLLQACGTAPSLAPVVDQSERPHSSARQHTVAAGDTLYSIAWEYGLDYRDIARYNRIAPPYLIQIGQQLVLQPRQAASHREHKPAETTQPAKPRPVFKPPSPPVGAVRPSTPASVRPKPAVARPRPVKPVGKAAVMPRYDAHRWRWPAPGRVVSSYSAKKGGRKGLLITGKRGEPVMAANSGKVVYSGSGLRGYGRLVIIMHSNTYLSAYGQNEWVMVKQGDIVKAGQQIATMGSQYGAQPALYFEVRRNGRPIDPGLVLPRKR